MPKLQCAKQSTCAATQTNSAPREERSSGLKVVWRERIKCDRDCGSTMLTPMGLVKV
jgi:hypothetical protein